MSSDSNGDSPKTASDYGDTGSDSLTEEDVPHWLEWHLPRYEPLPSDEDADIEEKENSEEPLHKPDFGWPPREPTPIEYKEKMEREKLEREALLKRWAKEGPKFVPNIGNYRKLMKPIGNRQFGNKGVLVVDYEIVPSSRPNSVKRGYRDIKLETVTNHDALRDLLYHMAKEIWTEEEEPKVHFVYYAEDKKINRFYMSDSTPWEEFTQNVQRVLITRSDVSQFVYDPDVNPLKKDHGAPSNEAQHAGPDVNPLKKDHGAPSNEAQHAGPDVNPLKKGHGAPSNEEQHAGPDVNPLKKDHGAPSDEEQHTGPDVNPLKRDHGTPSDEEQHAGPDFIPSKKHHGAPSDEEQHAHDLDSA